MDEPGVRVGGRIRTGLGINVRFRVKVRTVGKICVKVSVNT